MEPVTRQSEETVDVAVGVVTHADGRVLLAERPGGKPAAGYWEFPGGKFKEDENPKQALARELHEELGMELDEAYPWITRSYSYPHMNVRLHMYRVLRWHGEPHGCEGQQLSWENPRSVGVSPLLPANHSIIGALNVPQIYAISNALKYGSLEFMRRLQAALEKGVRLIQIREKKLAPAEYEKFASDVAAMAHDYGARVLVNGDQGLCHDAGADGVHLPASQLLQLTEKPPDIGLCAASCHNREELLRAAELEVDFVVLSPVLPTASHPGESTLGWDHFEALCHDLPMPVFALGGMKADMLETAMTHSAHGVALLSGIW